MQILYVYAYLNSTIRKFDYLENSLVFYRTNYPLQFDPVPAIYRKFKYRVKKPRSSYADNPHI